MNIHRRLASVPLLPFVLSFSCGILVYVAGGGVWAIVIPAVLAIAAIWRSLYVSLLLFTLSLGSIFSYLSIPLAAPVRFDGPTFIYSGEIIRSREAGASQVATVRISHAGPSVDSLSEIQRFNASIIYPEFSPEFEPGQTIIFKANLTVPQPRHDIPDEMDFADICLRQRIYLTGVISPTTLLKVQDSNNLRSWGYNLQQSVVRAISESRISADAKNFLNATLAGDNSMLPSEMRESFSTVGLAHLLAISGLHLGIIVLIASVALLPLYILGFRRTRLLILIIAIWIFTFVTGMSPSVVRAAVMTTVFIFASMLQRRYSPLNSLCFAALVILLFDPAALLEAGFQLSFAAVLSILLLARKLNPISERKRWLYNSFNCITVSISAMIGTGIISIFYYHTFPVYFLLANVVAVLLMPVLLTSGFIVVITQIFGWANGICCKLTDLTTELILNITNWLTNLPYNAVENIYLPAWTIIPTAILIATLRIMLDKPKLARIALFGLALTMFVTVIATLQRPEIEDRIYLSRATFHTELIYPRGDSALVLVTTATTDPTEVLSNARFRYADYMGRRGIKEIVVDTFPRHADRLITTGEKSIALISGKEFPIKPQKVNYPVLCRGFRGEIRDIIDDYHPDTILLAFDLHPRRAMRYKREASEKGVPTIWLRDQPWSMALNPSVK